MAEYHKGAYRQGMEIDPVAARPLGGTGGRAYLCEKTRYWLVCVGYVVGKFAVSEFQ